MLELLYMLMIIGPTWIPLACRELQNKVKAGEIEPEVAMLNAAVVSLCCHTDNRSLT